MTAPAEQEAIRARNRRTVARAILDRYEAGDTVELLSDDYGWGIAEVRALLQLDRP
jgi:uncharacterized protein (DUF433 family)